ncbi:MAG: carbohydrate ABC transporter substrate-binding protein, partial [Acholeplasmataceae bacterium]
MKKLLVLLVVFATAMTLAACESGTSEIYLLQNKPEIDTQLKEFAILYEQEYGVKVNVVSCGGSSCQTSDQLQSDIAAGETPDI